VTQVLITLIRLYQRFISPLFAPACRYVPTCSEYAVQAIAHRGAAVGSGLALWRLLRCNPFVKGGLDQVPLAAHAHCAHDQIPLRN
jgi:uncharacterized protein